MFVRESINFERNQDPKKSLNIGLRNKRLFKDEFEILYWLYWFPDIPTDGRIKKWSDVNYTMEINTFIALSSWVNNHLAIEGDNNWMGLRKAKDIVGMLEDILQSEKNSLKESIQFNREGSPLKKLDIGIITWEKLKPGDIIKNKGYLYYEIGSTKLCFAPNEDTNKTLSPGRYFVVKEVSQGDQRITLELYLSSSIFRHAHNISQWIKENGMGKDNMTAYYADKSIEKWDSFFTIIQLKDYDKEYES